MTNRAVFLDRDGTLIEEVGYAVRPEQIRILRGVARALARLAEARYKLVVVTNQSGIARGLLTEQDLNLFHQRLDEQLELLGARVDVYYTCPHHPDPSEAKRPELAVDCDCRKPKPGLLLQAAQDLDIDLKASWMVGDMWRDIQAGQAAGVRTIKMPADAQHEEPRPADTPPPTAEVADLEEAADVILDAEDLSPPPPPPAEKPAPVEALPTEVSPAPAPPEVPPVHHAEQAAEAPAPQVHRIQVDEAAPEEPEERPAPPEAVASCARCGGPVMAAQVLSGEAARHDGHLLCPDCLGHLPTGGESPESSAEVLKELLVEVRRLSRTRHTGGLSLLRLMAYVAQAGAVFCGLGLSLFTNDRTFYIQVAILLQLVVVALLLFERNS